MKARCFVHALAALGALVISSHDQAHAAQLLPTPRDGDIRTVIWELQNRLEVFLTLELRTPDGRAAPLVTLSAYFPGRVSADFMESAPRPWADTIELRAYAGALWAPRAQFWLALDGEKIVLAQEGWSAGLVTGAATDYLPVSVSGAMLNQIADAERVRGNALGFEFLSIDSQRRAIRAFRDRITRM